MSSKQAPNLDCLAYHDRSKTTTIAKPRGVQNTKIWDQKPGNQNQTWNWLLQQVCALHTQQWNQQGAAIDYMILEVEIGFSSWIFRVEISFGSNFSHFPAAIDQNLAIFLLIKGKHWWRFHCSILSLTAELNSPGKLHFIMIAIKNNIYPTSRP